MVVYTNYTLILTGPMAKDLVVRGQAPADLLKL